MEGGGVTLLDFGSSTTGGFTNSLWTLLVLEIGFGLSTGSSFFTGWVNTDYVTYEFIFVSSGLFNPFRAVLENLLGEITDDVGVVYSIFSGW